MRAVSRGRGGARHGKTMVAIRVCTGRCRHNRSKRHQHQQRQRQQQQEDERTAYHILVVGFTSLRMMDLSKAWRHLARWSVKALRSFSPRQTVALWTCVQKISSADIFVVVRRGCKEAQAPTTTSHEAMPANATAEGIKQCGKATLKCVYSTPAIPHDRRRRVEATDTPARHDFALHKHTTQKYCIA